MLNKIKKILFNIKADDEYEKFKIMFEDFNRNVKILDIGCGTGAKIEILQKMGFNNVYGVEKNIESVKIALSKGFKVFHTEEFKNKKNDYDILIFSHIIEHFNYLNLKEFLEYYFTYLKDGGLIYIATPILYDGFYEDFDHVKPYYPQGLLTIFSEQHRIIQFQSKYSLKLINLYFRKSAYQLRYFRSLYIKSNNKIPMLINIIFKLLFKFSGGVIGTTTGWQAMFRVKK